MQSQHPLSWQHQSQPRPQLENSDHRPIAQDESLFNTSSSGIHHSCQTIFYKENVRYGDGQQSKGDVMLCFASRIEHFTYTCLKAIGFGHRSSC